MFDQLIEDHAIPRLAIVFPALIGHTKAFSLPTLISTLPQSVDRLAWGHGPESPANIRFRERWLWFRFGRLKTWFDRLTLTLFSDVGTVDSTASVIDQPTVTRELGSVVFQVGATSVSVCLPTNCCLLVCTAIVGNRTN